jgi:hypothetical protein
VIEGLFTFVESLGKTAIELVLAGIRGWEVSLHWFGIEELSPSGRKSRFN